MTTLPFPRILRRRATATTDTGLSPRAREVAALDRAGLETALLRGVAPDLDGLVGWEFRGINTMAWAPAAGIKKFIKGFYRRNGEVHGYNLPAVQDGPAAPWRAKPSDDAPRRFGYYRVAPVEATSRDNRYLHAVLLDYGQGDNARLDPSRFIRDYVVQVDADDPDVLLGKAYLGLGPIAPSVGYFVLDRRRPAPVEL
jgi:hypothetical protein